MSKVSAGLGAGVAVATWILLFVILGVGLGTSFIAAGVVLAAGVIAAGMAAGGPALYAPLTAPGLLVGIATFVILRVVLSVPLWIDVVSGLGALGLYDLLGAALAGTRGESTEAAPGVARSWLGVAHRAERRNGHSREPVGVR